MAGHLARNQVHAGSIPAAQTNESADEGRQLVPKTRVVVMSPRGSIPPLSSLFSRRCPLTAGDLALNQGTVGSTPPSVTHDRFG